MRDLQGKPSTTAMASAAELRIAFAMQHAQTALQLKAIAEKAARSAEFAAKLAIKASRLPP